MWENLSTAFNADPALGSLRSKQGKTKGRK
jgi:hypothetical protein